MVGEKVVEALDSGFTDILHSACFVGWVVVVGTNVNEDSHHIGIVETYVCRVV